MSDLSESRSGVERMFVELLSRYVTEEFGKLSEEAKQNTSTKQIMDIVKDGTKNAITAAFQALSLHTKQMQREVQAVNQALNLQAVKQTQQVQALNLVITRLITATHFTNFIMRAMYEIRVRDKNSLSTLRGSSKTCW